MIISFTDVGLFKATGPYAADILLTKTISAFLHVEWPWPFSG